MTASEIRELKKESQKGVSSQGFDLSFDVKRNQVLFLEGNEEEEGDEDTPGDADDELVLKNELGNKRLLQQKKLKNMMGKAIKEK